MPHQSNKYVGICLWFSIGSSFWLAHRYFCPWIFDYGCYFHMICDTLLSTTVNQATHFLVHVSQYGTITRTTDLTGRLILSHGQGITDMLKFIFCQLFVCLSTDFSLLCCLVQEPLTGMMMSSSTKKSALQCLDYLHLPIMLFTCVMFVIMSRLMSNVNVWHKRLWHVSSRGHIFPTSLLLWVMCHRHQVFCRVLVARWLSSLLCHFQPKIL